MALTPEHAARVLGAAGDPAADTPALDTLAARGTRFANAYCPSPLCVPSRMAFLTGLEPHVSGVLSNDDFLRLQRENEELKQTIENQKRELQKLMKFKRACTCQTTR